MCSRLPGAAVRGCLWVGLVVAAACPGRARAEVYGGIEIGSKGVKATVVEVARNPEGDEVKVVLARTANTTLVSGLGERGRFDPEALRETAREVGRFYDRMRREHGVAEGRVFVVASSGLLSPLKGQDQAKACRDDLAAAVRRATGRPLDFIDAGREVELTITGAVPPRYVGSALLFDVGSGNTKGGYREGRAGRFVTASVPYGTVTLTNLVRRQPGGSGEVFADRAAKARHNLLAPALKKQKEGKPGLASRERVYLSGGSVWALATLVRPGDRRAFVELSVKDITTLRSRLRADPRKALAPDLDQVSDPKARAEAAADLRRVRDTFTAENLMAGMEILQALADEFGFAAEGKKLLFVRNGHVAWILAYVAEKGGAGK